jgi:hypothetical protein
MDFVRVRPAHELSLWAPLPWPCAPAFLMALREPRRQSLRDELMDPLLERPIGVISRPESELASQNFKKACRANSMDTSGLIVPVPSPRWATRSR